MAQDYSRAIARGVVAQLAADAGFERMQASAHESLADLLMRFVSELGTTSHSYAELAGRTASNINDVLLAFEDMGVRVEELMQYASAEDEVPFAHPVSKYPAGKRPALPPSFADKKEEPPKHVPSYLPAFPDKHTYTSTPAFAAHDKDTRKQRAAADAAKRKAEEALVALAKRQASLAPAPAQAPGAGQAGQAAGGGEGRPQAPLLGVAVNPFLAQPLWEEQATAPKAPGGLLAACNALEPAAGAPAEQASGGDGGLKAALGLDQQSADWKVEWREAALDAAAAAAPDVGDAAPVAPFSLDWAASTRAKALGAVSNLPFEDAFAAAEKEASPEPTAAGRRRKLTAKGRTRSMDPKVARAEHILALGGQAPLGDED